MNTLISAVKVKKLDSLAEENLFYIYMDFLLHALVFCFQVAMCTY